MVNRAAVNSHEGKGHACPQRRVQDPMLSGKSRRRDEYDLVQFCSVHHGWTYRYVCISWNWLGALVFFFFFWRLSILFGGQVVS